MPKDYFYNLKPKKVENVIEGAIAEFSEHSLKRASINRIIERIGISRGSFYNYFVDIDDLYEYVVEETYTKFFNELVEKIHESYGNVGLAFKKHMENIPNVFDNGEKSLVRMLYLNLETKNLINKDSSIAATVGEEQMVRFVKSIDRSRYRLNDQEFKDYTDLLFMILTSFFTEYVKNNKPFIELYTSYSRKIDLLDSSAKV